VAVYSLHSHLVYYLMSMMAMTTMMMLLMFAVTIYLHLDSAAAVMVSFAAELPQMWPPLG
jgi:hypothetical protein